MPRRLTAVLVFILIITALTTPLAQCQNISIEATIEPSACTAGERVTYTVTISSEGSLPDIAPPDFGSLEVLMGPSTSTSISIVNGRMNRSESYTYILRARQEGTYTIPAVMTKGKRTIQGNAVTLEALPPGKSPLDTPPPSAPDQTFNRSEALPDAFLVARADKDSLYVQEMTIVTYDLYFRVNVGNYAFPKLPQATGFWQEEIKTADRPAVRDTQVRGQGYKVATIRKEAYFPTRDGNLTIEPAAADVSVEVPQRGRRRSIWDDPFFSMPRSEVRTLTARPIQIKVLPLPNVGKPVDFKGDVGNFRFSLSVDKNDVKQHEAINLKVTVSGDGYIRSVDPLRLTLPDGFESFDPTREENIKLYSTGMKGTKTFNYLVIPRRMGDFTLGPLRFSFFEPDSKTYRTASTGSLSITVSPASGENLTGGNYINPERVSLMGQDIHFIKDLTAPLTPVKQNLVHSPLVYGGMLVFPLLYFLGLGVEEVVRRRNFDPRATRLRRAPEGFSKAVRTAQQKLKTNLAVEAVSLLEGALLEWIGAATDHPAAGLTMAIIEREFMERGCDENTVKEIKNVITEVDFYRFGGGSLAINDAGALMDRIRQIAKSLEGLR